MAKPAAEESGQRASLDSTCPAARRPALRASPSEVRGPSVATPSGSPRPALPLMEVRCSSESCMRTDCGDIGFPASARASAFQPGPAVFIRPPSTASFRTRLHPPSSFPPPSEYCDRRPALRTRPTLRPTEPKSASHGVPVPHRGVNRRRPLLPGVPTPRADVPSSTFRTSSTVCSATCLAGLFHPAATSRVRPPGDCPSRGAVPGFPGPFMPSCRWAPEPAV